MRQGLADQLHLVFLLALPLVAVVFLATLAIKPLPLRETANASVGAPEEAGHELLDAMSQSAPDDTAGDALAEPARHPRTRHPRTGCRSRVGV